MGKYSRIERHLHCWFEVERLKLREWLVIGIALGLIITVIVTALIIHHSIQ